jgi:methionine sulfoxide reductase heme-binding subunit
MVIPSSIASGPRLIALVSAVIAAGVVLTLWWIPDPELAWRAAVRLTARSSAVLFLLAFTAAATATLWPGRFSRWTCRNRRYLGLSFAASHTIHAFTFLSLAGLSTSLDQQVLSPGMVVAGGIGYVFIYALAATSSDRAQALLGMRWWRRLHLVGTHWLWLQFLISFVTHAAEHVEDWIGVLLVLTAMLLRVVARLKTRRAAGAIASPRAVGAIPP